MPHFLELLTINELNRWCCEKNLLVISWSSYVTETDKDTDQNNCGWGQISKKHDLVIVHEGGKYSQIKHARPVLITPTEENSDTMRNLKK